MAGQPKSKDVIAGSGSGGPVSLKHAVRQLRSLADATTLAGLGRYAIPTKNAIGVPVGKIRGLAKSIGRDHELADALWANGLYEARMLAVFVEDPAAVTPAQMDEWCRDFDNWAICDTACFHLFDRTPHAWRKIKQWSKSKSEFVKRAAFALLAGIGLHDKDVPDEPFLDSIQLIELGAGDPRNFVKKGVSWALRTIGHRNAALHGAAIQFAERLALSKDRAAQWVGKDALRDLRRASLRVRIEKRSTREGRKGASGRAARVRGARKAANAADARRRER